MNHGTNFRRLDEAAASAGLAEAWRRELMASWDPLTGGSPGIDLFLFALCTGVRRCHVFWRGVLVMR